MPTIEELRKTIDISGKTFAFLKLNGLMAVWDSSIHPSQAGFTPGLC